MATYTAGEQINRALRLLGVLAEGETPTAAMSQDSLMALNQMIESWNTERLSVFATIDQIVNWPTGSINETLGPSGSLTRLNGTAVRPILVDDATYFARKQMRTPRTLWACSLARRCPRLTSR